MSMSPIVADFLERACSLSGIERCSFARGEETLYMAVFTAGPGRRFAIEKTLRRLQVWLVDEPWVRAFADERNLTWEPYAQNQPRHSNLKGFEELYTGKAIKLIVDGRANAHALLDRLATGGMATA